MYHIGFIIEQALGHITHGKTLKQNLAHDPSIASYWGLPRQDVNGLLGKVGNWTVKAGMQSRQAIRQMQREAKRSNAKIDALFFHTQVTAILAQDRMSHIPSVVSLDATPLQYDSLGEFYNHQAGGGRSEKVKFWLNQRCYQQAKHIVTWSQWAKDGLIGEYGISAEKITVIPPGVNPEEWKRPTQRTLNGDAPLKILFVGGNLDRKGGKLLLEASQRLLHKGFNIELHLATRDKVADQANVFVYNHMQPNSPELRALYHDCDIFCLPTYGDCLPMVLSEAAAAGMPSISTNVAAIPEIIRDQETGWIVPTGNVDAIESAIQQLIEQPERRLEMGMQAQVRLGQTFDAEKNARRLLALLKQVADQSVATPNLALSN
ncbi:MAG: glycosyltransferase family 4 protein [Candidatus Promineifilaceae bacterium]